MNLREKYFFWRLANYFLEGEDYHLIHLHEEKQELWLENPARKKRPVVRIQMKELSWINVIERDINQTFQISENLRKQMGKTKLHLTNIYISSFEPIGDIKTFFDEESKSKNNKIILKNKLITGENINTKLSQFEKDLEIPSSAFEIPNMITEKMVSIQREEVINYITKKVDEEQKNAHKEKPLITYIFIALQIINFLFVFFQDMSLNAFTLTKWGAKYNPLIYEGEWFRFITPIFLHASFMHLLANCLILYIVGPWAEKIYGKWRYTLIFIIGGVVGAITGFTFNIESVAIGSSTSVFAVFGALLYLVVLRPYIYAKSIGTSILALVIVNLVLDLFTPNIGIEGHIGGLIGGFFIAATLSLASQYIHWRQLAYGAALIMLSILFLYTGYKRSIQPVNPAVVNSFIQQYFSSSKPKEAQKLLRYLIKNQSADEYTYTFVASEALKNKNYQKAEEFANKAIAISDTLSEPHHILSVCKLYRGDNNGALIEAQKARELSAETRIDNDPLRDMNE